MISRITKLRTTSRFVKKIAKRVQFRLIPHLSFFYFCNEAFARLRWCSISPNSDSIAPIASATSPLVTSTCSSIAMSVSENQFSARRGRDCKS